MKHVVVISDGAVVTTEQLKLVAQARTMREAGMTVSMIQVADDGTDPSQRELAERVTRTGGGQYIDAGFVEVVPAK